MTAIKSKQSPTCPQCSLGWIEEITLRNELWKRCMSCGWMEKVNKKQIKPMRGHESN